MPILIRTFDEMEYKNFIAKFKNFEGCEERNDLPDEELDSTKYKTAFCGKCKYNREIKEYHVKNFYPYCSCISKQNFSLKKCSVFRKDDCGFEMTKECRLNDQLIKICPKGYIVLTQNHYDLMIFESSNGKSKKEILHRKSEYATELYDRYKVELQRLNNLYTSILSKIYHTFTLKLLFRKIRVIELEYIVEDLFIMELSLSTEFMLLDLQQRREEREKFNKIHEENIRGEREKWRKMEEEKWRKMDEDNNGNSRNSRNSDNNSCETLEDHYSILGFKNSKTNVPTEEQVKKNYKKMALKFHPDKNLEFDTTEIFTKISRSYEIISKSRNFN